MDDSPEKRIESGRILQIEWISGSGDCLDAGSRKSGIDQSADGCSVDKTRQPSVGGRFAHQTRNAAQGVDPVNRVDCRVHYV